MTRPSPGATTSSTIGAAALRAARDVRGGWTLEAAEAVCGDQRCADVLGSLERLVENSLVLVESGSSGQQRMRMLETIREFATHRLRESGDEEETRRRHAAYFDDFVQSIGPLFSGRRTPEAMMLLDDEWENIEATVAPRVAARAFEPLVEIASATWRYVWLFDRVRDATAWMPSAYEARDARPRLRGELCRIGAPRFTSSGGTRRRGSRSRRPWTCSPIGGLGSRGLGADDPRGPAPALRGESCRLARGGHTRGRDLPR